jgi:hypothetical protein
MSSASGDLVAFTGSRGWWPMEILADCGALPSRNTTVYSKREDPIL